MSNPQVNIHWNADVLDDLRKVAEREGTNLSTVVNRAAAMYIEVTREAEDGDEDMVDVVERLRATHLMSITVREFVQAHPAVSAIL